MHNKVVGGCVFILPNTQLEGWLGLGQQSEWPVHGADIIYGAALRVHCFAGRRREGTLKTTGDDDVGNEVNSLSVF